MIEHLSAADSAGLGSGLNTALSGGGVSALPFLLDQYAGLATWAGKPIYTLDQVVGQIDSGARLSGGNDTFTYGFLDGPHTVGVYNNPNNGFTEPLTYSPFSEAQKDAAREAMKLWDDLIPQHFVEKKGNGVDILMSNTQTGPAQAWTYYPGAGYKFQGDVWTATPDVNWTNNWLQFGGYGMTTIVHELGHALGLSHPGDYNYSDDNDGDGEPDPITYEGDAFYAQDTNQFSIMSYFGPGKTGAQPVEVALGLVNYAQTPLLHDIYVLQQMYGADPTTRAGDTVYGFNSNAGDAVYDFSKNQSPYLSIYDAGGNDTIDLSGANASVFLDLRSGGFSSAAVKPTLAQANAETALFNAATDASQGQGDFSLWTQASLDTWIARLGTIGANRVLADTGVSGVAALSHRNISIAYGTTIENAIGGAARDYLVGNEVNNKLVGNGGDDVLNGLGGSDTLTGGAGADEFRFTALGGRDVITDFTAGSDFLNLKEIDASTAASGDQAFTMVAALSGVAGQAALTYQGANQTTLSLDVNGDGKSDLDIVMNGHVTNTTGWLL